VTGPPPALLLVDGAAERVEDGVQVRADPQPEERDVVAGVADHRDPGPLTLGSDREGTDQSADEAGATDAAGKNGDLHGAIVRGQRLLADRGLTQRDDTRVILLL